MGFAVPAYAKLNLTLDVLGRRADGFHEIASVMQTISLHDLLVVERSDCKVFEATGVPVPGENLVLNAARALEAWAGRALPFRVRLHKRIPLGAGLGGGSADAAAFLWAAVRLYPLEIPEPELVRIAAAVGQDVPFFLRGGTALATGAGSTVEALPSLSPSWAFLVATPPVQVSTPQVYAAANGIGPTRGRSAPLVAVLRSRGVLDAQAFGNDLEPVTGALYPQLGSGVDRLRAALPQLRMTGTGSAFYAAFATLAAARTALEAARMDGIPMQLCRPVPARA